MFCVEIHTFHLVIIYSVHICTTTFSRVLHRILHRFFEVFIRYLQIMLVCYAGGIAQPGTNHVRGVFFLKLCLSGGS